MPFSPSPYGHFNPDGTEFIVTRPDTPRAFDNFLWNDVAFANVIQTGGGSFDYQFDDREAVQLLTGVGRICDFDVFGRDHLMSRLFYLRDNETGHFWNLNWEPVCADFDEFNCRHGLGYTIISSLTAGIRAELRIFLPSGRDAVELWTLRLINTTRQVRQLSLFSYNQFQFKFKAGFDSYGDMIFRGSRWDPALNAVVASKHPFRRPHDFLTGFLTSNREIEAYDGTRDGFVGVYRTLAAPRAVVEGRCSNTPGSSDATIAAAQWTFELAAGQEERMDLMLGATEGEGGIAELRERYLQRVDEAFAEMQAAGTALRGQIEVETPDIHFNRMVNHWVKQAALFGGQWCRWGWMGYRDIVQHGLGVSALLPARTKSILREALGYQYSSGLALRGWNPIDEKPYSDSALWLVFTLTAYLKETGDLGFLQERVSFYDEGDATVLNHIERALDFLENNKGSHELLLIKFGDWNDSLTGVGKEGRGESVFLSQAYAEALREMEDLYHHLGDVPSAELVGRRRDAIVAAVNREAWDGAWYTRCFDDAGEPVGSARNRFARIFMESQAWALIAGIADDERRETLISSCDDLLGTPMGYRLLSPTYTEPDDRIGRISYLEPGICENGTVYAHLNVWFILGLLRSGKADKAYEVWQQICPGYGGGAKAENPPYMFANCYYGPDHRVRPFQMEFTWITGSLAWFNTILLNEMLGVQPTYDGLLIRPNLPPGWDQVSIKRTFRGKLYDIEIKKEAGGNPSVVSANGRRLVGGLIKVS
jgi:cellobiose phosphorylase